MNRTRWRSWQSFCAPAWCSSTLVRTSASSLSWRLDASDRLGGVVAVEPSPREVDDLRANLELNRVENVVVVVAALGEAENVAPLLVAEDEHSGHNTLGSFIYDTQLLDRREVEVTTLDDVVVQNRLARIDLIKIDVEGAELAVLRGGLAALRDLRPVILMEVQADSLKTQGASVDQVFALLRGSGYAAFSFDPSTGTLSGSLDSARSSNIVAAPTEKQVDLSQIGLLPRQKP